jgi:hypothetical protein
MSYLIALLLRWLWWPLLTAPELGRYPSLSARAISRGLRVSPAKPRGGGLRMEGHEIPCEAGINAGFAFPNATLPDVESGR